MQLHWQPTNKRRAGFTLGEILVSFAVFGLVTGGLVCGYVQVNRMAEFSSMSLAAQSFASQGVEEAKSVQWNYVRWPNTNATSDDPFWTAQPAPGVAYSNGYGYTNLTPYTDTLDVPTSGAPILVTNFVTVTDEYVILNTNNPILRQIRCDCVWTFPLDGTICTNTAITLRAPDQ